MKWQQKRDWLETNFGDVVTQRRRQKGAITGHSSHIHYLDEAKDGFLTPVSGEGVTEAASISALFARVVGIPANGGHIALGLMKPRRLTVDPKTLEVRSFQPAA